MPEYIATLNCVSRLDNKPHRIVFDIAPPSLGEEIWCFRCARMSRVIRAPYEWVVRCLCNDGYRHRGMDRTRLWNLALGHARTHAGHTVVLTRGNKRVAEWTKISEKVS